MATAFVGLLLPVGPLQDNNNNNNNNNNITHSAKTLFEECSTRDRLEVLWLCIARTLLFRRCVYSGGLLVAPLVTTVYTTS